LRLSRVAALVTGSRAWRWLGHLGTGWFLVNLAVACFSLALGILVTVATPLLQAPLPYQIAFICAFVATGVSLLGVLVRPARRPRKLAPVIAPVIEPSVPSVAVPSTQGWDPNARRGPANFSQLPEDQLAAKVDELMAERHDLTERGYEIQNALYHVAATDEDGATLKRRVLAFRMDMQAHEQRWWPEEVGHNFYFDVIPLIDPKGAEPPYWRAQLLYEMGAYLFWLLNHDAKL
jgi:hypothetical protein